MKKVLFLCSENAARSQMAEVLLRQLGGDSFAVFSAGTNPSEVDPRTLQALEDFGLTSEGLYAKSLESLGEQHYDYVISLCDKAHQECRTWPGSGVVLAWDFADPRASRDPKAFARTLQELSERLRLFVLINSKQVKSAVVAVSPLDFYKAMADETRLLSLLLIEREGEMCVCELTEALELSQPKISRHLSGLRKTGLLLDRRQGQWVFYRLHPMLSDWMRQIIATTAEHSAVLLDTPLQRLEQMTSRPSKGGNACVVASVEETDNE